MMHLILGIFAPARFGIPEYEGYNTAFLDDKFRALIILKSNFSITNRKIPFFFNGACSFFTELPKPQDINYNNYK